MRPLAVFDVDGVLADVRHRLRHVEARPKDWDAFFAAATQDPPLAQGVLLAQESAKDCEVVYVTGRPERCRDDTLAWFARHHLPAGQLAMRRKGDRRPARVAKPQLLATLAQGRVVAVVVDDDAAVCRAYEASGYRVLQASWMTDGSNDPGGPEDDDGMVSSRAREALRQAQEDDGRT